MSNYIYPGSELDQRDKLLALLGSHWYATYAEREFVASQLSSRAQLEQQNYLDLLEMVASLSQHTVPVWHRENWYLLLLRESQLNQDIPRYGEGFTYADGIHYGQPTARWLYSFPIPADLQDAPAIHNRITVPSRTLMQNIDYRLDTTHQRIVFNTNPFDDPLFPAVTVYEESRAVDRETALWVQKAGFDRDHIFTHFGYILDLKLVSSEAYRQLVSAILQALAQGTAAKHVNLLLSALTGVPVVRETTETIELITTDRNHLVICTDQHCYTFDSADAATVAVGDVVHSGDFLTQAVQVDEINRGQIPASLLALETGPEVTGAGLAGGLLWKNEDTQVLVETVNSRTKVSWALGGFSLDVDAFWDEVHRRGVADGTTLAQLLDIRRAN